MHLGELQKLTAVYNAKGWRTTFFHKAAWISDTNLTFVHEFAKNQSDGKELSSRLEAGAAEGNVEIVPTVDLGQFIRQHILTHQLTGNSRSIKGPVVMKMDVEGAEYTIMPNLIVSGAVCGLDTVALEWHQEPRGDEFQALLKSGGCPVELVHLDDESYYDTSFPLPE
jgi:hypothetical protein